ncbi:hypothetical protein niasHT_001306 [Heterodera trifolii]|uniref:Uncharacterized protein n=1 Tax=Heterodera trifolii TaxID=157864 RepID=A0ABD2MB22_9BILA
MDDQSLDQSAGDQKAQYRRLKKESAEQDERISQLYEKKLKQEKQLAEQDERLARLRSNSEFQDAEIKRQAAEIKVQAEEIKMHAEQIKMQAEQIKVQAEEIKLLRQQLKEKEETIREQQKKLLEQEEKLAQQGQKILELENDVGELRKIVDAMAEQFIPKNVHQKLVEEYEIKLAGLSDHRNWQKSEAEQILAHHLCDAKMEVKQLDYELTEHKKKRDTHTETREFADAGTQHNDLEELGETGSQTDIKQFTDIGTQTNGQFIGHWRLLIGLFIIVLFVCGLLYNQFGPFRIAIMLHYIRGPPPF